ncbi:TonB-dependent receptor domain-containing protein [Carboxylicivirga sp. N1Y90]|uniref:TonB-dependent receptor domain-containing protein n=1 Tax=Carboxylicivirga fragile TaxID=3417571 RepID=UPI003D34930C|nr:TonB-dependent receptor [Marinilabiliaceae bacterium N1Y90]
MSLKHILITLLCLIMANNVVAQINPTVNGSSIILIDANTKLPIIGVNFIYGDQHGASDKDGLISFQMSDQATMKLSHLNYGKWEWNAEELKQIVEQGSYSRMPMNQHLFPVMVIAMKPGQKPDAGIGIDYQERLEHDGAKILNQMPAFNSIRKSGNYGFDPVFRGFKYDQLNLVIDGAQSATAACPNRMDPPSSQISTNLMDRVEVYKGPHALRYGTGFGGTINFIPSQPRFSEQGNTYGRLSTAYETNGNIKRGEGQLGFSDSKYDLSLFGAWSQGRDYTAGNGEKVKAGFLRSSFGTRLGLKISKLQQLSISATYNRARDVDFPALAMDLRNDDTWLFNARHEIQILDKDLKSWNTTLFASFVDHFMDNRLKQLDPRMLNAETAASTYNYGGRTEGIWEFSRSKLFAGADLRIEGAEGTRVRTFIMGPNNGKVFNDNAWQDANISKSGLFAEYQLNTNALNYVFSGRLERNYAKINDPSPDFTSVYPETDITQINPNLSIGIQKHFGQNTSSGLYLGRAQRSGSLTERFINYFPVGQDPYEMLGNPKLDPEVNNQVDLTFEWKNKSTAVNIDLFAAYLQDYISSVIDPELRQRLPNSPGVRRYINIDDALKTGFEMNWTQALPMGLKHQLGIAYTYAKDLERKQPLPEIAPLDFRYALMGTYLNGKLIPELTFRYVTKQDRISEEYGETATPDFSLLDLKLGYAISEKLKVNAMVNNLLDETYYEHLNRSVRGTENPIYAPGRNFFIGLTLNF